MGARTGSADLPLHGGRVPDWLASRMARLGRVVVEALVLEYGRREVLRRLAHPFWFQSLGAVMGMDWHSSGITTSVVGALKRGLAPVERELGLHVCGGRGRHSRKTPNELRAVAERAGLDGERLARTSRLVAKIDNAAVQDGYALYLHAFVIADEGAWAVVQQGMNGDRGRARRYHWLSDDVRSFVDDPHSAIEGESAGTIVNLVDGRAAAARRAELELVAAGPDAVVRELRRLAGRDVAMQQHDPAMQQPGPAMQQSAIAMQQTGLAMQQALPALQQAPVATQQAPPHLSLPGHHEVRADDVLLRRLRGALATAAERAPAAFEELLLVPGVGARTLQALALVAEVVHGAPSRFTDPARFSFAHGGKDRHPFPVPLAVYDRTLAVLRAAVDSARLGSDDKLAALRRLDEQARALEGAMSPAEFDAAVARENEQSHRFGGMSVFGPAKPPRARARDDRAQLELPLRR